MASREIVLWLDERWYAALERHIKGESLQEKLEGYLDELCENLLPDYEYEQICKEIYAERMEREAQREADRRFAVFRIRERGEQHCCLVDEPIDFVAAARSLRSYTRSEPAYGFHKYYAASQEISPAEFGQYIAERMENSGRVVGAFEVDFDSGTVASLNAQDGWRRYGIRDVSTASFHADRRNYESAPERIKRLLDYLKGRELPGPVQIMRRLRPEDVSFSEEIAEMDGKLDFYMESFDGVDEVFGTYVCTDKNDDYVNVYADYDLERGEVADSLTVILHRGDGTDVDYAYPLSPEERAMLLPKMEAYCQQQSGMSLADYRE